MLLRLSFCLFCIFFLFACQKTPVPTKANLNQMPKTDRQAQPIKIQDQSNSTKILDLSVSRPALSNVEPVAKHQQLPNLLKQQKSQNVSASGDVFLDKNAKLPLPDRISGGQISIEIKTP